MINNGVYAVLAEDSPLGSASSFKYLIAWVFDQIPSFPTFLPGFEPYHRVTSFHSLSLGGACSHALGVNGRWN